jgi:RHS repeat-associated protein
MFSPPQHINHYAHGLEMPGRVYVSGQKTKEGYTGHELDAETGLNYAGARYYDSAIARWMSVDPLASSFPSHSPYNYVMGDPMRLTDPTGMAPEGGCPWCDDENDSGEHWLVQKARSLFSFGSPDRGGADAVQAVQHVDAEITQGAKTALDATQTAGEVTSDVGGVIELVGIAGLPLTAGGSSPLIGAGQTIQTTGDVVAASAAIADATYFDGSVTEAQLATAQVGVNTLLIGPTTSATRTVVERSFITETGPRVTGPAYRGSRTGRFLSDAVSYSVLAGTHTGRVAYASILTTALFGQ